MPRDETIMIEGRAYSWHALCDLRRTQREAAKAARGTQLTLFEMRNDSRPKQEHTAAGRYTEPGLLDRLR
jgi:hypothetical protein